MNFTTKLKSFSIKFRHLGLLLLATFFCSLTFAQQYDTIIKNGRIIDGSGNPWYTSDLAIKGRKIVGIGSFQTNEGKQVIDAKNQIVCPGFIDVHTHVEDGIKTVSTADNFIHDGVTSVITGNCGSSEVNLAKFFGDLKQLQISVNLGSLIGHNSVRRAVMMNVFRDPTAQEQQKMEALVEQAMKDGAVGLATGLIYIPGTYSRTPEVVGLAKAASKSGGIYASHIRDEGVKVRDAIEEAINIGREAHIPVEISHFKISSKPLWGHSDMTIGIVEKARLEGIDVNVDQYPYTASSTNMGTMLPSWALADGDSMVHVRLTNPETRKKIREEMIKGVKADKRKSYDYAFVARYRADSTLNGKNVSEINKLLGRKSDLATEADLIMDMVDKGGAQMVFHKMSEDDVAKILRYPNTMIASDAGVIQFNRNMPHPRGYGSNARVLGRYVREKQVLRLEDAVRRMTSLPAQRFKIENRGLIRTGFAADIVIFDENKIIDMATYEKPHAYSEGIDYVLVNGTVVLENGKHTGKKPGEIIYGKGKVTNLTSGQ
ncbi:amidohydrolase family protein [Emticicia sp. C21]|uniref:N-acyl-D-amino-acid deacylase family protein n=1 Tax=Emticicia sp. C21 TaxID=2302915 RepID=UPI000E34D216|nr:D-aminoacylase [Emticicia sp. C21]RFS16193.1 D-aminoacylase [Emticicia sp. C21]